MKKKLKAVGYTRVSTPDQVDNYSLRYQTGEIKKCAKNDCVELVKIFCEEGKSATNIKQTSISSYDEIYL